MVVGSLIYWFTINSGDIDDMNVRGLRHGEDFVLYRSQYMVRVCNRYNFTNMQETFLSFLSNKVRLASFKMFKAWLPSSSIKEIMTFLVKLTSSLI